MNIRWLTDWLLGKMQRRLSSAPDVLIIDESYMERWWIWVQPGRSDVPPQVPTKWHSQSYLHRINGPDYGRALHDHPWWNVSIVLSGSYTEVLEDRCVLRKAGDIVFRRAKTAHRIADVERGTVSLFLTGRKVREWGFRTQAGFLPWRELEKAKADCTRVL